MYVCICKKITDTQIIREIELGATTVNDVSQRLGTSSQCGKCKKCVRNIVRKQRK
ncbi:MAG: (2Fe-2S)-binding protein, partial [Cocleimonas sp.]|nr:(2Fe-2S)-binding protein [Cocleimonas sp.]